MNDEIADDPSFLHSLLALVGEWYAATEPPNEASPSPALSAASQASATRVREELMMARTTLKRQLQHMIAWHSPKRHVSRQGSRAMATADAATGDKNMTADEAMQAQRTQARRVVNALQAYNHFQTMTRLTFAVAETVQARPFDSERVINTLRSRLVVLSRIARTNRAASITATSGSVQELSNIPTLTSVGLQIRSESGYYVPFKLSLVTEVMWERLRSMLFGSKKQGREQQLSCESHDEAFGFVARANETPSGMLSSSGPSALRRVYEDDGSVLFVYTSVKTAPPRNHVSSERGNLLAGLTLKQAMWTRLRRAPQRGSCGLDRPLVYIETSGSLIMESTTGRAVAHDQVLRVWDAIVAVSSQESRSRQSLENQLLDLSMERQKKESSGFLQ